MQLATHNIGAYPSVNAYPHHTTDNSYIPLCIIHAESKNNKLFAQHDQELILEVPNLVLDLTIENSCF